MNAFEQLRLVQPAAAPQLFEEACASLIRATISDASRVRVFKGDGGVDVHAGQWAEQGSLDVYQIKYFPEAWGDSQKGNIRESYKTAANNVRFRLRNWTLCVPTRLTQDDWHWWFKWSQGDKIEKRLLDGDKLTDLLARAECQHVVQMLTRWGVRGIEPSGIRLTPEIYIHRVNEPPIASTIAVRLTNGGVTSARHLRVTITHSDTGCAAIGHDRHWWNETGSGRVNPRYLSANLPINPGDTVPVLSIPFRSDAPYPRWVKLRMTAEDCPPYEAAAIISAAQIESNERVSFTDASALAALGEDNASPSQSGTPTGGSALTLLDSMLAHPVEGERGLTIVPESGISGHVAFVAKVGGSGALQAMTQQDFNTGANELIALGWLLAPVQRGGRMIYLLNPTVAAK